MQTPNDKSCRHCHSFQTTGMSMLNAENQFQLEKYKQAKHFKKNEIIFEQGAVVNQVYCLRGGLIKLESYGTDGGSVAVGFLKGGDLLGLGFVLSHEPASYTAIAIEDTFACAFSADLFRQMMKDSPELAMVYLGKLYSELRGTQQRLLSSVEKDVSARVAEALMYLKANFPYHNFTRKEIAEWAGTTTESVIRTLSTFEDDQIIEQTGRQISIKNKIRLHELAGVIV